MLHLFWTISCIMSWFFSFETHHLANIFLFLWYHCLLFVSLVLLLFLGNHWHSVPSLCNCNIATGLCTSSSFWVSPKLGVLLVHALHISPQRWEIFLSS